MTIKLYGSNICPLSRAVFHFVKILQADGIEIKLEYFPIDFRKEEQKEEWFREIHPAGKTPAIKELGYFRK